LLDNTSNLEISVKKRNNLLNSLSKCIGLLHTLAKPFLNAYVVLIIMSELKRILMKKKEGYIRDMDGQISREQILLSFFLNGSKIL
jgi:hypothetical protein